MARSRSSSSEFGAHKKSFRLALGNSRPMTGVTSNDSKASRAPLSFKGARPGPAAAGTMVSVVKEGAIMVERNVLLSRGFRILKLSRDDRNGGEDVPFIPYFIRPTGISIPIYDIGYSVLATFDRNPAMDEYSHAAHSPLHPSPESKS